MQMAGMICAIANGGKIYWPRIATRLVSPDGHEEQLYAPGRLRDTVHIDPHQLELIRHAMLEDTEHPADEMGPGSAYKEFHHGGKPLLGNFRVAGKTGTAEVKSASRISPKRITWFDSYGPFENPRYAVIVMVEDGSFGGPTCGPVAEKIYEALINREKAAGPGALAKN
jgi:penicillin-binding protein 2